MMSILREKFRFQTGVKEQKIVHTYESHTKTDFTLVLMCKRL